MSNDAVPLSIHAACRFDASAAAFLKNKGFTATIVVNGAGDFTLELERPIDALESFPVATLVEANVAGGGSISCVTVSDTTVRITTSDGTALADLDFSLVIFRDTAL
jgi:hypothetical protein